MNDTKTEVVRVYSSDKNEFDEIRKKLSDKWGRYATTADTIRFLLRSYKGDLTTREDTINV